MTRTSRNEPAVSAHEPGAGSAFSERAEGPGEQGAPHAASFRPALPRLPTGDRWIGTRELPGYRAGCIVVKLADLPAVDAEHLYCDLMLLDAQGRTEDTLSGPCRAMHRHASLDERSIFVRMVAELLRHASDEERGILPLGAVLAHVREHGAQVSKLAGAALLLDATCSDRALVSSLTDLLTLSLGSEEAHAVLCGVVEHLARTRGFEGDVHAVNEAGLAAQVEAVVRSLGKRNARRYLREVTDFTLVPSPEMFGL